MIEIRDPTNQISPERALDATPSPNHPAQIKQDAWVHQVQIEQYVWASVQTGSLKAPILCGILEYRRTTWNARRSDTVAVMVEDCQRGGVACDATSYSDGIYGLTRSYQWWHDARLVGRSGVRLSVVNVSFDHPPYRRRASGREVTPHCMKRLASSDAKGEGLVGFRVEPTRWSSEVRRWILRGWSDVRRHDQPGRLVKRMGSIRWSSEKRRWIKSWSVRAAGYEGEKPQPRESPARYADGFWWRASDTK